MKSKYILMNFMIATTLSIVNVYADGKASIQNKDFDTSKFNDCTLDFFIKFESPYAEGLKLKQSINLPVKGATAADRPLGESSYEEVLLQCSTWTSPNRLVSHCNAKPFTVTGKDLLQFQLLVDSNDPNKVICQFTNEGQTQSQ
jgi:hypothetical protein